MASVCSSSVSYSSKLKWKIHAVLVPFTATAFSGRCRALPSGIFPAAHLLPSVHETHFACLIRYSLGSRDALLSPAASHSF